MEKLFFQIQKLKLGQSREYLVMFKYKIKLVIIQGYSHSLEQMARQLVVEVVAAVLLGNHNLEHSKAARKILRSIYKIVYGLIYKMGLNQCYLRLVSSIYHHRHRL